MPNESSVSSYGFIGFRPVEAQIPEGGGAPPPAAPWLHLCEESFNMIIKIMHITTNASLIITECIDVIGCYCDVKLIVLCLVRLNPHPCSVFRHLRQCRGGGGGATAHICVSKLSVVELSGKNQRIALDEYS